METTHPFLPPSLPPLPQALQISGIDDQTQQHVLPLVRHAVEDRSWRVRQALARDYAPLSIALKGEGGQRSMEALHHDLLPGLVALLQDNEAEVRIAALTHAYAAFCPLIGAGLFTQHLLPCAHLLAPDSLPGVRLALSTACLDLAPLLGQAAFMQHLMPLLERFLMDPNAPDVKVRLHILSRLAVIGAWLPSSSSSSTGTSPPPSILPILLHLRDDDNWRLRKAAIEALPVLAEHMSTADHTLLFEPALLPHLLSAFQDRVCQVRMAATGALHHLARVTGPEFIQSKVLPRMKELYEESGFYLVRSAVLQAMKVCVFCSFFPPSLPPSLPHFSFSLCLLRHGLFRSHHSSSLPPSLLPSLPPVPPRRRRDLSFPASEILSLVLEATTQKKLTLPPSLPPSLPPFLPSSVPPRGRRDLSFPPSRSPFPRPRSHTRQDPQRPVHGSTGRWVGR